MKSHSLTPVFLASALLAILAFTSAAFAQDNAADLEDTALQTAENNEISAQNNEISAQNNEINSQNNEINSQNNENNMQAQDVSGANSSEENASVRFSLMLNVGPNYAFSDRLKTSGKQNIDVPTAGLEAALDIGIKTRYFGAYFEVLLRGGAVLEDDPHFHCPGDRFNLDDVCFKYYAVEKGDWDSYFMGLGLMLYGFIPASDFLLFSLGVGFTSHIGMTTDRDTTAVNTLFKGSVGFHLAVTQTIALGMTINYEGASGIRHSLQPAFSMIYHY